MFAYRGRGRSLGYSFFLGKLDFIVGNAGFSLWGLGKGSVKKII